MAIEALTSADDGTHSLPTTEAEWSDWVGATAIRNFMLEDPLLDWLEIYGRDHGFQPDPELPDYDWRTDFYIFIKEKALQFEVAVLNALNSRVQITVITAEDAETREYQKAVATFTAMVEG